MTASATYGMKTTLPVPLDEAEARVRAALAEEGFGVLTEIDVQKTLKTKLDVDMPAYRILGACAPPLAHQALGTDPAGTVRFSFGPYNTAEQVDRVAGALAQVAAT